MAAPAERKVCRPVVAKRPRAALMGMAAAALAWASSSTSTAFAGLRTVCGRDDSAVCLEATYKPAPEKFRTSRYQNYDQFVYLRKRRPFTRLRLDRIGTKHHAYYRILAQFGKKEKNGSGRFNEHIGFWNPCVPLKSPDFFGLKCDRAVRWLRHGAQPTPAVADLLDRAGIIRRTGPNSKLGEWEWRVPKDSGPDKPEGWSYDGPHAVTWNNKPAQQKWTRKHRTPEEAAKVPIIEKHGFIKYTRIPLDQEALSETIAGSELSKNFPNTELGPM